MDLKRFLLRKNDDLHALIRSLRVRESWRMSYKEL